MLIMFLETLFTVTAYRPYVLCTHYKQASMSMLLTNDIPLMTSVPIYEFVGG